MHRHSYRLYVYGKDGGLIAPAMALNVDDDEVAIAEATPSYETICVWS